MIVAMLDMIARPWWDWIVAVTWQAGLLAAFVLLADLALRRTAWPEMAHALWMLVFLRLVLPPALASPVSLAGLLTRSDAPAPVLETAVRSPLMVPDIPLPPLSDAITPAVPIAPVAPAWAWPSAEAIALVVWLAGIAVVAGWIVSRMRALGRLIGCGEPAPTHVGEALDRAARAVRLRRKPAIRITPAVAAPAVCGLVRPVILLPADDAVALSGDELGHVLMHECAHVRRGDLLANAAATAFLALFWFNPLVWIAHRRLGQLRELACDATVARALRERTPDYRRTLARFARRLIAPPRMLGAPGLMEGPAMISRRLRYLDGNPWRGAGLRRAGALLAAIAAAATVVPMCVPAQETESAAGPAPTIAAAPRAGSPAQANAAVRDTATSARSTVAIPRRPPGAPGTWTEEQRLAYFRVVAAWTAAGHSIAEIPGETGPAQRRVEPEWDTTTAIRSPLSSGIAYPVDIIAGDPAQLFALQDAQRAYDEALWTLVVNAADYRVRVALMEQTFDARLKGADFSPLGPPPEKPGNLTVRYPKRPPGDALAWSDAQRNAYGEAMHASEMDRRSTDERVRNYRRDVNAWLARRADIMERHLAEHPDSAGALPPTR